MDLVSKMNDAEDLQSFLLNLVDNVTVVHDEDGNPHFYGDSEDIDGISFSLQLNLIGFNTELYFTSLQPDLLQEVLFSFIINYK